ncbi:myelin expression factor 2 isoform X2 [Schistocerca americana]|nr:myelin expression factor 2 isoform X2 [Schistocerca americana]XP_047120737.1 myelin expression factor 2 isoform X2 [Schistocerca piceifrons]XP_049791421.1 myelin expression factor 2 isoform X2 [Schistocerca nitens]XP_049836239.1 myelin expression factor 2 isoform X2 [Schistocerca gregaria]XP_049938030.1 myelin expression factor 2 isoform X2 [Schistocerca serialis cubense]
MDRNEENDKDRNKERDRDRARRGDRPTRFGPRSSSTTRDRERERGRKSTSDRRIYVSNIAYEYKWQELKDLFRQEVGEVSYVELFMDENDKPRGCGIVEFESPESVKKAVEKMHRFDLKGRKLVVKEDFGVDRDKYGRPIKGGGGGGGGGAAGGVGGGGTAGMGQGAGNLARGRDDVRAKWDHPAPPLPLQTAFPALGSQQAANAAAAAAASSKWGNTYGLSPEFLESLWITGPLNTRVFVANLDYKVDEKKLKEVFKLAGKVVSAEISTDKEGKSRGFGVVEYEHPVEAVQAISMLHNQMLYDRKITVRMDRIEHKQEGPLKLPEGLRGLGMGLGAGGAPLQDVARNLPSVSDHVGGLVGAVAGGAAGLGTGIGAASALSNVVGPASLGLSNNAALPASLTGVGGLGAAAAGGLMGAGGGDIGLGGGIGAGGAFGGSNLGAGLGAGGAGLGVGLGGGGGSFGGNIGTGGGSSFMGGGAGGAFGGGAAGLVGNSAFGGGGRDFDSLNSSLGGGGGGGGYGSGLGERDFRGAADGGFANGPSRGIGMGGAAVPGHRGSDTILIKNLPPSATWQMLRDKYGEIGDVKFAEIRGKEIGLVRFSSELEAERAVHMTDRTRLEGRTIDVSLFY